MRKNHALRKAINDCVLDHGGIANMAQMRAAVEKAGIPDGQRYLDRYAQTLASEGVLRRTGKGIYVHVETLDGGTLGIFGRMPYGTHLYGRILHAMLTSRFINTTQVIEKLRAAKYPFEPADVYDAMNQLKDRGYIDAVGTRMYKLSRKSLAAIGIKDVLAPPGEYQGTLVDRYMPRVRELLAADPPKHVHAIHAHLLDLDAAISLREVHRIIHRLRKREPVRRTATATYTLLPELPTNSGARADTAL